MQFCLHMSSATLRCVQACDVSCWTKLFLGIFLEGDFCTVFCLFCSWPSSWWFNELNLNKHFSSKVLPVMLIKAESQPSCQLLKLHFPMGRLSEKLLAGTLISWEEIQKVVFLHWNVLWRNVKIPSLPYFLNSVRSWQVLLQKFDPWQVFW